MNENQLRNKFSGIEVDFETHPKGDDFETKVIARADKSIVLIVECHTKEEIYDTVLLNISWIIDRLSKLTN